MKIKTRNITVMKSRKALLILFCSLAISTLAFSQTANDLFDSGMKKLKLREFDSAIYYFNLAMEIKPDFAEAMFRRGLAKDNSGRTEEAYEDYSLAIGMGPKAVYYNNRGILRYVKGDHTNAIADYDSAIGLDPDYLIAIFNKGRALFENNDFEEGCDCMQDAYKRGLTAAKDAVDYYCN
ncbi:MAG: hypothetical protein HOD63_05795 [Bacteroidetes bacterium]|jgi:tetratricopeptide (TPR) repeat protein|nr:hypothetical protein [Bacteroidota bacterium]MBT5530156.1 hypothetical protein [Cytophagia bacterium]MBT4338081.1 hypothetical protein [Bacteroidota bacterium]MBT4729991.1 hypothetical protein [Bacteroidota bacterium]MBT5991080.1 hypothetical protein [Bacteroidota bacterium]